MTAGNSSSSDSNDRPQSISRRSPRQASTGDQGLSEHYHIESERSQASIMPSTRDANSGSIVGAGQPKREGSIGRINAKMAAKKWLNQAKRARLMEAAAAAAQETSTREFRVDSLAESRSNERSALLKKDGASAKVQTDGAAPSAPEEAGLPTSTFEVLKSIVLGKTISVFLLLMPLAWYSAVNEWNAAWIFWLNFFVMVPLAAILGDFTEELALHTNETIGGLVNATFGNAVEVVVAVQALLADEIRVVQASMIGSIFSNLLLVLGSCFFFGGMKYKEQSFNSTAATANMGLLALSSIALVLPTPFAEYYNVQDEDVLLISRFAAIFLMFMYIQLLVFQLKTHAHIFDEEANMGISDAPKTATNSNNSNSLDTINDEDQEEEEEEEASISMTVAMLGLLISTLLVTFFSEFLVDSIDGYCKESGVSRTFVGLIILPIVGNAVEHITAISVAMKNKMDLAMGVAVGSCTQISLFVVPLTVLVGWVVEKPMTLNFPHFEIILYILSVFTVSVCLSTPRSNWLEGSLLITTYLMIAVGFWFEKVIDFR